ncbi:extracellular solute-binding protein [Paenibacillus camerounensis]|uniref:extracellular solute-binding protein n=1 Tax=Paenibacillus camerounensis TaxID=1243663 RepID=UPI0005A92E31|nr:extracellular solute-binding protein [Paenibacillus camerounensis]
MAIGHSKGKIALGLSAVLASSVLLSACSQDNSTSAGEGGAEQAGSLKIEVFDRGNAPAGLTASDNFLTDYVKESFGQANNIDVEFVPIPRSEEVTKLNVLMASGTDVPDIVFTYDSGTFNKYAEQGGLTDLTPLLDEYGPNLKAFLGEATLKYGQYEGVQYSIPAKRSTVGKYASFVRQDWLDKLGLPVPTTTEELYNTLIAFKEKDPGETGGKVIPLGMTIAPGQYESLIWSFIQPVTEQERFELTQTLSSRDYPILLPGFKDAVQYMNKLYNEGLISKDFALDENKETLTQNIGSGLVGAFSEDNDNIFYPDGAYDVLLQNHPDAVLTAIDPYTNSEGKHAKPVAAPNGMYVMIPKSSKHAVEAIKYLDWMASEDHLMYIQNGIEGEHYTLENGVPVTISDMSAESSNKLMGGGDIGIIANGRIFESQEKNNEAFVKSFKIQYQDIIAKSLEISNTDAVEPVYTSRPIEAESKYGTTLGEKIKQLIVKSTMVSPAEFDATYESMLKDYMGSGGQSILDERKAAYSDQK